MSDRDDIFTIHLLELASHEVNLGLNTRASIHILTFSLRFLHLAGQANRVYMFSFHAVKPISRRPIYLRYASVRRNRLSL